MSRNRSLLNLPPTDLEATLRVLHQNGVSCQAWKSLRQPELADRLRRVVNVLNGWQFPDSIHWTEAKKIMGRSRFFGPGHWRKYFGEKLTPEQLESIAEFPWSKAVLNERFSDSRHEDGRYMFPSVAETHFAFLGLSSLSSSSALTILQWKNVLEERLHSGVETTFEPTSWGRKDRSDQPCVSSATCEFRWYLFPTEVSATGGHQYWEQFEAVGKEYEVCLAVERATMIILHQFLNGGSAPAEHRRGRCLDGITDNHQHHATVSGSDSGVYVSEYSDEEYELGHTQGIWCSRIPGR